MSEEVTELENIKTEIDDVEHKIEAEEASEGQSPVVPKPDPIPQPMPKPAPFVNGFVQFTVNLYNKQGQYVRSMKNLIMSSDQYNVFSTAVLGSYYPEVRLANISTTKDQGNLQSDPLLRQVQLLLNEINQDVPNNPSTQSCQVFDIICEKIGAQRHGVVLTTADFSILKQNDHVFTVLPVNPQIIQAVPNTNIHELSQWIIANSITPVADVPANDV